MLIKTGYPNPKPMEVKVIAIPFVFVSAIALFVSLVINIFVVAVFAEVRTLRYDN